ncbi:MAG: lytic transglycosylase domain-containing protein [Pseudomonadota bacterium]|nr:lytic transglycosylase domain-containing protein [Pseudomonadota bacterium]
MSARTSWTWVVLAGAALLWAVSRTRRGQLALADALDDPLEFITVSAERLGTTVRDTLDNLLGEWTRRIPEALRGLFATSAAQHGLPVGLLEAVAYRESRFRQDIIDGRTRSSAGAVGIMQIIPRWHPELGEAGALDPQRAIPYAAGYLQQLQRRFGTWPLALAAYNWGQGNLAKWQAGQIKSWPAETTAYVEEITRNAGLA